MKGAMKTSSKNQLMQKQPSQKRSSQVRSSQKRSSQKTSSQKTTSQKPSSQKQSKTQSAIAQSDSSRVTGEVDAYIKKHTQWQEQLTSLHQILTGTQLQPTIKWGAPSFTLSEQVVVSMHAFKQHCALWFHQGVFLADKKQLLINAGEGKTRGLRQLRFDHTTGVDNKIVKAYVEEAIKNEKAGKKIVPTVKQASTPPELKAQLDRDHILQKAFAELSPGKQREYAEYIGGAKQEQTRFSRLQKIMPMIKAGVGLHDKYRKV